MTEPDLPVPSGPPSLGEPGSASSTAGPRGGRRRAEGGWWQRNRRRFWLVLALFAAATAPIWGGLILLWLFSPSSPFPQG